MAAVTSEDPTAALDALLAALPDGVVVTDPDRTDKYRWDRSQDPHAGTPLAVVRAEHAGHVQTAVRWAAERGVPVVPRGAGTGLSGGSSAVDGGIVLSLERMTRGGGGHGQPGRRGRAGSAQQGRQGRRRRARPVVPAGPRVVRDLLHRRQRRHQRRRPVLREVRRDHRLRARARRGPRRRHPRHPGRAADQGRGGPVAAQALRRQRGHARDRDPRRPAAGAGAGRRRDPGRVLPDDDRRRGGRGRHPRPAASVDARAASTRRRSAPSRTSGRWGSTPAPARC